MKNHNAMDADTIDAPSLIDAVIVAFCCGLALGWLLSAGGA